MTNFVKFSNKYLTPFLTLDLPWSCAIKDYSSRRESILSFYKPCITLFQCALAWQVLLMPGHAVPFIWIEYTSTRATFSKKLIMSTNLWTARTFSTEFSQTWRCDHSKAEYFIFVLDNSHQNLLVGSKDMTNFVKFSNKYLQAIF